MRGVGGEGKGGAAHGAPTMGALCGQAHQRERGRETFYVCGVQTGAACGAAR